MNATDIIAYIVNECDLYCTDCAHDLDHWDIETVPPVFATEEFDYPAYCVRCNVLIPVNLTEEGQSFVREEIRDNFSCLNDREKELVHTYSYLFEEAI